MKWLVACLGLGLLCALVLLWAHRSVGRITPAPVPDATPPLMIEERHLQRVRLPFFGREVDSGYLVYLPRAYRESDALWPLICYLHGSGESGSDLDIVAMTGLPKRAREVDLPFVIVAPQCPRKDDWTYRGELRRVSELIETVATRYRIDRRRIYLTGNSMGGYAVWDLAVANPHRFAAIAPICGRGRPASAPVIRHLPVWVFHGALDPGISVDVSRRMVKALRACGSPVRYTEYADGLHDVWTRTYRNPELLEWFLSHRLPAND